MRPRTDFSDLAAERSFAPAAAYVQSKLANLLFGSELERRLRRSGSPVRSFLAHPGMASTPMHDTAEGFTQKAFLVVAGALLSRPAEAGLRAGRRSGCDVRYHPPGGGAKQLTSVQD
jgi:NAD(P)-dependent dehydrogenase (short-subunit alcohol dehydrogenase family)